MIYNLGRHLKTAVLGILRNFWMSVTAVTAVTITLLLLSLFALLSINIRSFSASIEEGIPLTVRVDKDYDTKLIYDATTKADPLGDQFRAIEGVKNVVFSSKDAELNQIIKGSGSNASVYERYREKNPLYDSYYIYVKDGQDYKAVQTKVQAIEGVKQVTYGSGGVFTLVELFNQVDKIVIIFMGALLLLVTFLISNTIKLTIYARKTEIQIMRLVGASNGYIRFPFILEGIFIGMLGSIIPVIVTLSVYGKVLESYSKGFYSTLLQFAPQNQIGILALLVVGVGALVGMFGSIWAVGRYLKA